MNRLAHRLGFSEQKNPDKIEQDLMRLVPQEQWFDFTYADRPRARALHREEPSLPRVPGRAAVPGQPGVNARRPARPMVVAHRGASVEQPENTIAAFEAAVDAGADAVEFDVRMTADGHAVVMHDPDVSRTTVGTGVVSEMTLEETGSSACRRWRRCDASPPRRRRHRDQELARRARHTPDAEPAVEATLSTLDEVAFRASAIVSSFNPRSIAQPSASPRRTDGSADLVRRRCGRRARSSD